MSRVARRIRAIPVRTATDTWEFIVDLIASNDRALRSELALAGNAAAMLIAEEHTAGAPILLSGCGPQVRIYTLHGDNALDPAVANELPLTLAASSAWQLALPTNEPDLELALTAIRDLEHVTVYDSAGGEAVVEPSSDRDREDRIHVDLKYLEG